MSHARVEFSPEALAHVEAVAAWWSENRGAAPSLFSDELAAAVELLASAPRAGGRYERATVPEMRRLLMPRTRYHVYYTVEASVIRIHAVWHAARGQGPPL